MLEMQPLGQSAVAAAAVVVVVDPSSNGQRIGQAVRSTFCNRECLIRCKERTITVVKYCAPLLTYGAACSLLAFGAWNLGLVGLVGLVQGTIDNNRTTQATAGLAAVVGVAQLKSWSKLMDRHQAAQGEREASETIIESMAGATAAVGCFLPATRIAEVVQGQMSQAESVKMARLAVGILTQTASGMVISAVATVAVVTLVKGAIYFYNRMREARLRRANPDAAAPLMDAG